MKLLDDLLGIVINICKIPIIALQILVVFLKEVSDILVEDLQEHLKYLKK